MTRRKQLECRAARLRGRAPFVARAALWAALGAAWGCSSPESSDAAAELGVLRQAITFPALADWVPVQQANLAMGDPSTDGANNGREVVGDTTFPALFLHADDTDFMVRLRLNEDPRQGGGLRPLGWGVLFDTDGDFSAYEFSLMADGKNPPAVVFAQNTSPGTTGSPQDVAETDLSSTPIILTAGGNAQVSVADSTFETNPDFFLDFSIPLSVLQAAGISLSQPLRIVAGTSSSAHSISVDLAGTAAAPGNGTLAQASSDPTFLDGSAGDVDDDGVLNPSDLDNDGDGISDLRESALGLDPDADHDNDGIPDWRDANDRGDGAGAGCTDTGSDGVCDAPIAGFDADGDGIPNHNDLDSDNDGIPDAREAGHRASVGADGVVDGAVGSNGLTDSLETPADSGTSNYALLDTEDDGIPDFLDLDSDGDGSFDVDESGNSALDGNSDGRIDSDTTDADADGLLVNVDADDTRFGFPALVLLDTDGDGIPDVYDVDAGGPGDSDGDGIDDATECPGGWPCLDGDVDGTPDYMTVSPDADGDGVGNASDSAPSDPNQCRDVDNDSCDDCATTGANGSGGNPANDGPDGDADGICDAGDLDADNDGVADGADVAPANPNACRDADSDGCDDCALTGANLSGGAVANDGLDADADGLCDAGDGDDDNDGVADGVDVAPANPNACRDADSDGCDDCALTGANLSGGAVANDGLDADADGLCDAGDGDDDNDGVADGVDVAPANPSACRDADNDGCDDCALTGANLSGGAVANDGPDADADGLCDAGDGDDDNDGVADGVDVAPANPSACRDADNDGCDDCALTGANLSGGAVANDGLDADADGLCDAGDGDDDNDGVADGVDVAPANPNACSDTDNDGCDDCSVTGANLSGGAVANDGLDADADGLCDAGDGDDDNDGVADGVDVAPANPNACRDADNDGCDDCTHSGADLSGGKPDADGCSAAGEDLDGDGVADADDADADNDGLPNADESTRDADGDGLADWLDLDSDDDGIPDSIENALASLDADADGVLDDATDSDGDGLADGVDADPTDPTVTTGRFPALDTDRDGLIDAVDLDADGDGVSDVLEAGGTDADGDGHLDSSADADQDGLRDAVDPTQGGNALGLPDTDADGDADFQDLDDDGDGIGSAYEDSDHNGQAIDDDTDGDGIPNYLDPDDDGDGIATSDEHVDEDGDGWPDLTLDSDADGLSDYLDPESSSVFSYDGVHVRGGGFNCSIQLRADDAGGGPVVATLGLLLGLAWRRRIRRN